MQIHSKIAGTKGFVTAYNEALRFRDMITREAEERVRILTFWHKHGLAAAKVSGQPEGSVMTVEFELDGNKFLGLNGGPIFKFSPATSFIINCKTQEEIDYFWSKLGEGGKEGQCGWIDFDKFGVSWQIVPEVLGELMSDPDPMRSESAMQAILQMKKIDIAGLKKGYESR